MASRVLLLSLIGRTLPSRFSPLFGGGALQPKLSPLFAATSLRSLIAISTTRVGGGAQPFSTTGPMACPVKPLDNWSSQPPEKTVPLAGCDFEHWLVVMESPDEKCTRDEIINSYVKTLAQVMGSEQDARMAIYSVSTKVYYAFGAKVSEGVSEKIKDVPRVRWVLPDSYLDPATKDYGGEPFINGNAVPYDPKYHEDVLLRYKGGRKPHSS